MCRPVPGFHEVCEAGSKETWNQVMIKDFAETSAGVNLAMVKMITNVGT